MSKLSPIEAPALNDLPGIRHAYFTRPGGVSSGIYMGLNAGLGSDDDRKCVVENRRRMTDHLGVDEDELASPYQVHSPDVIATNLAWKTDRPQG